MKVNVVKNKSVQKMVQNVSRRDLVNNTQRVLVDLLSARTKQGWVARTSIKVPSAAARIRDLRKDTYGGFRIECAKAEDIDFRGSTSQVENQTYYRIVPSSVTSSAVRKAFKGVID